MLASFSYACFKLAYFPLIVFYILIHENAISFPFAFLVRHFLSLSVLILLFSPLLFLFPSSSVVVVNLPIENLATESVAELFSMCDTITFIGILRRQDLYSVRRQKKKSVQPPERSVPLYVPLASLKVINLVRCLALLWITLTKRYWRKAMAVVLENKLILGAISITMEIVTKTLGTVRRKKKHGWKKKMYWWTFSWKLPNFSLFLGALTHNFLKIVRKNESSYYSSIYWNDMWHKVGFNVGNSSACTRFRLKKMPIPRKNCAFIQFSFSFLLL